MSNLLSENQHSNCKPMSRVVLPVRGRCHDGAILYDNSICLELLFPQFFSDPCHEGYVFWQPLTASPPHTPTRDPRQVLLGRTAPRNGCCGNGVGFFDAKLMECAWWLI